VIPPLASTSPTPPSVSINVLDHNVSRCDGGVNVARPVHLRHHDVVVARQNLIGAGLHGFQRVKDTRQFFVLDVDCCQCSISSLLIHRRNSCNRIPLETHLVDNQ